jgi:pimeloyl-ACP methyl ester carboxylesterase
MLMMRPAVPTPTQVSGEAAGVPFVAIPPVTADKSTPVVVAWHLMSPPRTEAAFAAALPLDGLDAWRIYLGLPLYGSRLPPGGLDTLMQWGFEDAVMNLQGPVTAQAAEEFGPALAALRERFGFGAAEAPLGLVGGSLGAAVAQLVLAESEVAVQAAVLVSPLVRLEAAVDAIARQYGISYPWSEPSLQVARRLDFVARADELVRPDGPATLLVVGEDDDRAGFLAPAVALHAALAGRLDDPARAELVTIPGLGHDLAEEPGTEPAAQLPAVRDVDRLAVEWFRRYLILPG